MTVAHNLVDHILLKGGVGAPTTLLDGELAIDHVSETLYLRIAPSEIIGVPLDVIAKPPTPVPGDTTLFLVKTADGCNYEPYVRGAGGRDFDTQPWRVPGFAPTGVSTATFGAGAIHYALFDLPTDTTLNEVRLDITANTGVVTYGVCEWINGEPGAIVAIGSVSGTGVSTPTVTVDMLAGNYATFVQGTSAFTAQVLTGFLRNARITGDAAAGYIAASGVLGSVGAKAPAWTALTDPYQHPIVMGF